MTQKRRENVGKLSYDLQLKNDKVTHSPLEQTKEQLAEYEKNVEICLQTNKEKFDGDFYIVVDTKKERAMQNVIRNYFYARFSCPTPNYDQVVYKYTLENNQLVLIWVIPDRSSTKDMKANASIVPPEQWELLGYVLKFADGTLFKLAKELNGEKDKTPELKDKNAK